MTQNLNIELSYSRNGQLTAIASRNGEKPFYLHSSVNPVEEAEAWASKIELTKGTLYLVMGVGLGYHIEALLKRLPADSHILVLYTSCEANFLRHAAKVKTMEWLNDKQISFLQLIDIYNMGVAVANFMLSKMIRRICLCRYFPAMRLDEVQYYSIEKDLVTKTEQSMKINFSVAISGSYHYFKNYWLNFSSMLSCSGISTLKKFFRKAPVIIVAAGPSLDKNIHLLKQCKDRAIIIAAGTGVSALVYHGIQPDFLVFNEASPKSYKSMKDYLSTGAALVTSVTANHQIIDNYCGPVYFFRNDSLDYSNGTIDYFKDIIGIRHSVSVATSAVDFAVTCGAKTIILIGQDLAFSDQQEYAQGTKGGGYKEFQRISIPGYYGREVMSIPAFKVVIDFYTNYVLQNQGVSFINATEGGAQIPGMVQDSLQNIISSVLPKKQINKSFIKDASQYKRDLRVIANYLHKMRVETKELFDKVDDLIQKKDLLNTEKQDDIAQQADIEMDIQEFQDFFESIPVYAGYRYIENVIRPRLVWHTFQKQDGMPQGKEYLSYRDLLLLIGGLLEKFLTWTSNNINEAQIDGGGRP